MSVADRVDSDAFLKLEANGIEEIPSSLRRGRPQGVALIWVAAFANFASLITGALLVAFGLGVLEAIVAVAVGSLACGRHPGLAERRRSSFRAYPGGRRPTHVRSTRRLSGAPSSPSSWRSDGSQSTA